METHSIKVVGILLTYSETLKRVTIQNVFRLKRPNHTEYTAIHNNIDKDAMFTYAGTVTVLECLYAQDIETVWISETEFVRRRYYQFDKVLSPSYLCLPGHWMLWAQRN